MTTTKAATIRQRFDRATRGVSATQPSLATYEAGPPRPVAERGGERTADQTGGLDIVRGRRPARNVIVDPRRRARRRRSRGRRRRRGRPDLLKSPCHQRGWEADPFLAHPGTQARDRATNRGTAVTCGWRGRDVDSPSTAHVRAFERNLATLRPLRGVTSVQLQGGAGEPTVTNRRDRASAAVQHDHTRPGPTWAATTAPISLA